MLVVVVEHLEELKVQVVLAAAELVALELIMVPIILVVEVVALPRQVVAG